jgi:5-methylcytosine-specific restriction endonuclease McrA
MWRYDMAKAGDGTTVKTGRKRDYDHEKKLATQRGETASGSSSGDATRHRARRKLSKKIGRKLSPDEHVDHKKTLKEGGSNSISNLKIRSAKSNKLAGAKVGGKGRKGTKNGKSKSE